MKRKTVAGLCGCGVTQGFLVRWCGGNGRRGALTDAHLVSLCSRAALSITLSPPLTANKQVLSLAPVRPAGQWSAATIQLHNLGSNRRATSPGKGISDPEDPPEQKQPEQMPLLPTAT